MTDVSAHVDRNALADSEFRSQLRRFLETHFPAELRQDHRRPFRRLRGSAAVSWLKTLFEHGWRAPGWPREHGGMGLSFRKQLIYHEEMARANVARVIDLGDTQLGPTLMQYGSEEQKSTYLPRILDCEHVWCQGYSEPGAGSDLAGLRMRADLMEDHFLLNGQKIWTTHANESSHIFMLVRTGRYAKKQQGISFLLVDLKSPGITIRPIVNIAGEDEFCEVFFEDVRVPRGQLVGELDGGWAIAKALLGYERIWIGSPAHAEKALALALRLVQATGRQDDAGVLDQLGILVADLQDYKFLYAKLCDAVDEQRRPPGPEVSALKIFSSELLQRITEFNVAIAGEYGGIAGEQSIGSLVTDLSWQYLSARPGTIFAGANEIQRDILAKHVLRLPS